MQYTNIICNVKVNGIYQIIPDQGENIKDMLLGFARTAYNWLKDRSQASEEIPGEDQLESLIQYDYDDDWNKFPIMLDMDFRDYGIIVKVTQLGKNDEWYFNSSLFERYIPDNNKITAAGFLELVKLTLESREQTEKYEQKN